MSVEEQHLSSSARSSVAVTVEAPPAAAQVAAPVLKSASAPLNPVTREAGRGALARAQAGASQVVPYLQYQITRLGPAGQAGLLALVAAVALAVGVVAPAYHSLQSLNADLLRAQHPSATFGLDQAVPRLVSALPTRAQIPAVALQVIAEAKVAGVSLDVGRYVYTPAKSGAIARYDFDFPVKASYPDVRKFIDLTLTAVPAAALSKLHVERKTVGDQQVNADIGFVVFVRSEPGS